ncbi:MAG: class I SAM-dependent methyltransferase [Proteobacteria bacterium]|nr:class I SAM-dependent methyltransferase [Pseudomonadota bacterium]
MAQLAAKAKKGYYKTPVHLISKIAKHLRVLEPEATRALDPCCGTGEALALLGDALGLQRSMCYGNELDEERFNEIAQFGINACCGDGVFELQSTKRAYSVLYLNPPYDDEGDGEGRTEFKFLQATAGYLQTDGILIYIIPEKVLKKPRVSEALPVWFKDMKVFRFPDEDYQAFGQVVFIGRRFSGKSKAAVQEYLLNLAYPLALDIEVEHPFIVPASPDIKNFHFHSSYLAQEEITSIAVSAFAQREMEIGLVKKGVGCVRTLMPLRSGHTALMLASGVMDGVYRDPGSGSLLVLVGETRREKEEKPTEHREDGTVIERVVHRHVPHIRALDLTASALEGEMVMVEYK